MDSPSAFAGDVILRFEGDHISILLRLRVITLQLHLSLYSDFGQRPMRWSVENFPGDWELDSRLALLVEL